MFCPKCGAKNAIPVLPIKVIVLPDDDSTTECPGATTYQCSNLGCKTKFYVV